LGDKIENEMGGPCSTNGEMRGYTGFWWVNLRVRDYVVDRGLDERIILRWDVGV